MHFSDLPVGAKFRFFRRGTLLTKTSKGGYTTPGAAEQKAAADVEVLSEEDFPPARAPAAPKPDDVTLLTKALDELEALQGKKAEPADKAALAAARQALRRLDAIARLKGGD